MAPTPSRLEIRLLGPPEVLVDGLPLRTDTRKAVALLAYLSQRDTAPDREHLVELLWSGSTPERGRGALRRTLATVRSALGGRWVGADKHRLHLDRGDMEVDTDRLRDDPAAVTAIARGRFMEGFWLRDAPAFDAWQATSAEHYDRVVRRLLADASESAMAHGDPNAASLAERMVALDPLDESAHRILMRAYAAQGDRGSATRQFRHCVAILGSELAVEPSPETVALHEAILRGAAVAPPRSRAAATSEPPPRPVGQGFIGREAEVTALRRALGRPGATWLLGPSGSGRSRLVAEAVPEALRVASRSGEEQLPHALSHALLDLLLHGRTAALDEAAAAAGHLHPGVQALVGETPSLDGDLGPARLLAGFASAVTSLADGRVLVVDDVDRADPASAAAMRFLAGRAGALGLRLLLVAEAAAGAGDRLDLGPLPDGALATLAEGAGLDVHELADATGGWPGGVLEVISDASPELAVDRLRERRVRGLAPLARQVAEALVVLGSTDLQTLAAVAGRNFDETAEAVDLLVAERLAVAQATVEPTPWATAAVLGTLGPARRTLLHGRAAEVLGRSGRSAAALARHLEQAGLRAEAAAAHWRAAQAAATVHAHEGARLHLRAAMASGHPEPRALHRLLGDVERAAGRYGAAVAAYHAAAAHGTDVALERSIGDVYRRWSRWDLALAAFEAAEALADPAELPLVLADRAEVALHAGDRSAAEALVERALDEGGAGLARVRNVAGLVLDDPEHLAAAVTLARRAGEREVEAAALNNLALAHLHGGRPELALESAQRAIALLDRSGDRHRRAALHGNLADIHHALGNEDQSRGHLRQAVSLFAEVGIEPGEWNAAIWSLKSW